MNAATDFTGRLSFSVAGEGVSVDPATGVLRIPTDTLRSGVELVVTAENAGGTATSRFRVTVASELVEPELVAPVSTTAPGLSGTGRIGEPISLEVGTWVGTPAPTLALQWLRDGKPISGATAATYTPGPEDDLVDLTARVTATNAAGTTTAETAPMVITGVAPVVVAPLAAKAFTQGSGIQTVEAGAAFAGANLRFAVTGAGASVNPATGLVSIPTATPVDGARVTVTASNSGGSASLSFLVTVEAVSVVSPTNKTIYVANVGNDGGDGSMSAPVASLAKAMLLANEGDTIALARKSVWRDTLRVAKKAVKINAYGAGKLPVISGADLVTGLATSSGGTERTGEIVDIDHNVGNTSEYSSVSTSGVAVSTDRARSGTHSLALTSGSGNARANFTALVAGETRYAFFGMYPGSVAYAANSSINLLSTYTSTSLEWTLQLYTNAGGAIDRIGVYNNGAGYQLVPITSVTITPGAWNTIELRWKVGTSNGEAELFVNGISVARATGLNTSGLVGTNNIRLRASSISRNPLYVDDFRVSASRIGAARADNLWTGVFATNPAQLFVDGVRGERVAAVGAVTNYRQWHWASNKLTVRGSPDNSAPAVEASVRDSCIDLQGCSGVTVENVRTERAGRQCILARTTNASTIQNCEVVGGYIDGIQLGGEALRTDMLIKGNFITDCGGSGIGFGGRLSNWIVEENEVVACGALTQGVVGMGDGREAAFGWTSGIKNWGWGGPGWQGYVAIRRNTVRDCRPVAWAPNPGAVHGHGIWLDEVLKPTARPEIHGNIVYNCHSRGVYLEKTDDHDVFNNLVYGCAAAQYCAGIEAQSNPYGYDVVLNKPDNNAPRQVSGNRIWNNTSVGGWWSFSCGALSSNCSISNTMVRDNIFCGTSGSSAELYIIGGGSNDGTHGSGNTYANNCFGPEGGSWVWGGTVCTSLATFATVSRGKVTRSVAANPLFQNVAANDYRLSAGSPCIGAASDGGNLGRM